MAPAASALTGKAGVVDDLFEAVKDFVESLIQSSSDCAYRDSQSSAFDLLDEAGAWRVEFHATYSFSGNFYLPKLRLLSANTLDRPKKTGIENFLASSDRLR